MPLPLTGDERRRAGQAVQDRLDTLNLTAAKLAANAGIDVRTVHRLIAGETWPRTDVRARLETALGWPRGACYRFARGGLPELRHFTDLELIAELWFRGKAREENTG